MNIIFLGPPGAGKGTQAKEMSSRFQLPHVSTGEMFRKAAAEGSEFGLKAKAFMDRGDLVPDEVVIGIVFERIENDDCKAGFILDGFPRTTPQAIELDKALTSDNKKIDMVINIDVERNELIKRLTGRRMCGECGNSYHLLFNPPSDEGSCDSCGGRLYQRDDDSEESVKNRLDVYDRQTEPLIDYYIKQGKLKTVDGGLKITEVSESVSQFILSDNSLRDRVS